MPTRSKKARSISGDSAGPTVCSRLAACHRSPVGGSGSLAGEPAMAAAGQDFARGSNCHEQKIDTHAPKDVDGSSSNHVIVTAAFGFLKGKVQTRHLDLIERFSLRNTFDVRRPQRDCTFTFQPHSKRDLRDNRRA